MKKKIVYITQWVARNPQKEYPHGWGFEPPVVEFNQNIDPAEASKHCQELSTDEFECIGGIPREIIDGDFEILGIHPGPEEGSEEWAMRDIDLVLDNADFGNDWKLKEIKRIVRKYFDK